MKRASSSSSGRADEAVAALCRAGGGGRPVIVVCSSLRKDGDGDSAVLMLGPGVVGGGDEGERDGLRPSQCPVDDGKQVSVAARRR
jgi:hypothetical protein